MIQSDLLNQAGHPSTWVVPCTTRLTGESLLRVALPAGAAGNREDCEIMVDQSRSIDNRRFRKLLRPLPAVRRVTGLGRATGESMDLDRLGVYTSSQ